MLVRCVRRRGSVQCSVIISRSQSLSEPMPLDYELCKCFSSIFFLFFFPPPLLGEDKFSGLESGTSLSPYLLGFDKTLIGQAPVN